jgi:hypothetical protein
VAGELIVLDHLEIMAANGFEFDVDDSAPAGTLVPIVQNLFSPCMPLSYDLGS